MQLTEICSFLLLSNRLLRNKITLIQLFKYSSFYWTWRFFDLLYNKTNHPSIYLWLYSPFPALASLIRRLHSSILAALLLHPLIPISSRASLCTISTHLVLGLPTGLAVWKFLFKPLFGILCSSILIICPAHPSLLNLMSSTMLSSLYRLQSSLLHLGRQHPPSCVGPYILPSIFLSNVLSICSAACVKVHVTLP